MSHIDVTCWAINRATGVATLQALGIADTQRNLGAPLTVTIMVRTPDGGEDEWGNPTFVDVPTEIANPVLDDLVPLVSAHIHPARASEDLAIVRPAVYDGETLVTPAETIPGWHVNIRYYGATALNLLREEPYEIVEGPMGPTRRYLGWTEADGLFERTNILDLIDARTGQAPVWYALEEIPQPPGYQMAGGAVRLYDPALISSQSCVFA
jgi:hypothetical protein